MLYISFMYSKECPINQLPPTLASAYPLYVEHRVVRSQLVSFYVFNGEKDKIKIGLMIWKNNYRISTMENKAKIT